MNSALFSPCAWSGLTEKRARFLETAGQVEAFLWKVSDLRAAHQPPLEAGDAEIVDRLLKFELSLARLLEFCRAHGWNREVTP